MSADKEIQWKCPEFMNASKSKEAIEKLIVDQPSFVVVCCVGENLGKKESCTRAIVVLVKEDIYVYHLCDDNKDLVKEGKLDTLLLEKKITKVFFNIGAVSRALIQEFDVLLNCIPMWDIELMYKSVKLANVDLEYLKQLYGFVGSFNNWHRDNETFGSELADPDINVYCLEKVITQGQCITELYKLCCPTLNDDCRKKLRAETYHAAIPGENEELSDKVNELKLHQSGKKQKQANKGAELQQQQTEDNKQKQDGKKQSWKQPGGNQLGWKDTVTCNKTADESDEQAVDDNRAVDTDNSGHESWKNWLSDANEDKKVEWKFAELMNTAKSKEAIDKLIADQPSFIVVCCVGENLGMKESCTRAIVVLVHPDIYVYHLCDDNKDLVKEGKLDTLLLEKKITKVFFNIGAVSRALIQEFDVLLNCIPIWDIELMYKSVKLANVDLEDLKEQYGFVGSFKNWHRDSETYGSELADPDIKEDCLEKVITQGQCITELFELCCPKMNDDCRRKLRAETYKSAIPGEKEELSEKVNELKQHQSGKKHKQANTDAEPQQQQAEKNKQQQARKRQSWNDFCEKQHGGKNTGACNQTADDTDVNHQAVDDSKAVDTDSSGPEVKENWDEADKKVEWKCPEFMNAAKSKEAIEKLIADPPSFVVVCCVGENLGKTESCTRAIVVLVKEDIYVYHLCDDNKNLVKEGKLDTLLLEKKITKVFFNIEAVSRALIQEFDVLLYSTPIWDIELMCKKVSLPSIDLEDLKHQYDFDDSFKKWHKDNETFGRELADPVINEDCLEEVTTQGKIITELYKLCSPRMNDACQKQLKADTYKAAIPGENEELSEKVNELKLLTPGKKQKEANKDADSRQQQTEENKQQQARKRQSWNDFCEKQHGGKNTGTCNQTADDTDVNHQAVDDSKAVDTDSSGPEVKEIWDEADKKVEWKCPEFMNAAKSKEAIEKLIADPPSFVVVCCVGENLGKTESCTRAIVVLVKEDIYVYHLCDDNKDLVKEGKLDTLLLEKKITKVFFNIGAVSRALIQEFDVLLNGIPMWDIELMCKKVSHSNMDLEDLKHQYDFDDSFKKWHRDNERFGPGLADPFINQVCLEEVTTQGKCITELYKICSPRMNDDCRRKLKTETHKAAIPGDNDALAEKVKELKLLTKQANKDADSRQQQTEENKQQHGAKKQVNKKHHGGGNRFKGKKR